MSSIFPLNTRRCVARLKKDEEKKKIQRWQKIVKGASQQCGRTAIPEIAASVISLEAFCDRVGDCDLKLLFWECETERKLADVAPVYTTSDNLLLREFVCPGCGALLDTEIALPGDPFLEDKVNP